MRLQKALAAAGIASRRKAIDIIESGKVEINGRVVTEKGFGVDIAKDRITVQGRPLKLGRKIYILLNKPKNCISTVTDERLRRTVLDLVRGLGERVYPVGRLDKNTTGLLLLTNDGELAFRLTHPRFGVLKAYEATVRGIISQNKIDKLRKGIFVDGRMTQAAKVDVVNKGGNISKVRIKIHEGRKHQVRLMFLTVGHPVVTLNRVGFGNLRLGQLKPGQSRLLSAGEVAGLEKLAGID